MFLFLCKYVDQETDYIEEAELTKIDTVYLKLSCELYSRFSKGKRDFEAQMSSLGKKVGELKYTMALLFLDHYESGLLTMKCHLLDGVCDDLGGFSTSEVLTTDLREHLNLLLKLVQRRTSMRRAI